jgi:pimeloyl-ACP methyl ester carboxylesterase
MSIVHAAAARMAGRRPKPGTLIAGAVFAAATAVAAAEAFKLPVDTSAPGLMIPTSHGRTHVSNRSGTGPSVIFESGLGSPLTAWSWVVQNLPQEVPFLTYDRPGVGWSHSAPPRWRQDYPSGLGELLSICGFRPPFILVGHSVGGLLIRMFANRYPEMVGGMVFVDPSPPNQYDRSQAARDGLQALKDGMDRMVVRSALRLPLPASWKGPMRRLPEPLAAASVRAMGRFSALRAARAEVDLSATVWADGAAELTSTPHPVAVVTSEGLRTVDPDYPAMAGEIAALSDVNRLEVVDGSSHMSLLTEYAHAARVTDAIQWVRDKIDHPVTADQ